MGKMNLLKANWEGKVGETVGAKWKDKSTIRTYTKPSNPDTQAQQNVRGAFAAISKFIAVFADQIKYLTALDVSGMSVRNAIIKINKEMIQNNSFDAANLVISKGGLQKPIGVAASKDASSGKVTVTWTAPTATNFTDKAEGIVVVVDEDNQVADVFGDAAAGGTATGTIDFSASGQLDVYFYFLDYRGSNKVASASVYASIEA